MNEIFNPKITVITITYNSEKTLEETIKSVLSQDYKNLEYIIIDGGSKDGTLDIIKKYRDKIAVVVSEPDNGISDAFNKGIKHATGEIIGIINSDDILMPGALNVVADNYAPNVDVYSGNVIFWDERIGESFSCHPEMTFDKLKLQYGVAHPSRFIRKDAYERFGRYDERFRYNMDIDLLCRFYKKGASFHYIDRDLTMFRMGGTTSNSIFKKKNDYRLFVQNYGGTKLDFQKIWIKAVLKYSFIAIVVFIFGEEARYKFYRVRRSLGV